MATKQIKKEPKGLTANQRKFRRAVINSGLAYAEFGIALGWTGKKATVEMRVQHKMRGFRNVTDADLKLIEFLGVQRGEDLFRDPDAAVKKERVEGSHSHG